MRGQNLSADGISLRRCYAAARGKTADKGSQLLRIKRPTAKYHLDNAKAMFGVKTIALAFAREEVTSMMAMLMMIVIISGNGMMKEEGLRPFAVKTKTSADRDLVVAALRPAPSSLCGL